MGEAGAPMQYLLDLWNEWEIQAVVVVSFSLQVILFFFAGIRRYNVSVFLRVFLWLVYLLADVAATYALGLMSSSLSKKSSGEHQLVAFWAPFLLLHLGGQDTITAYALEDNELWLRHLLNMFVQVAGTTYVLYKYINVGEATFFHAAMLVLAAGVVKYGERIWALKLASKRGSSYVRGYGRRCILVPRVVISIYHYFVSKVVKLVDRIRNMWSFSRWMKGRECITKSTQFGSYVSRVMMAHMLRQLVVKCLIIDRNEASIDWSANMIHLVRFSCGLEADESENEPAERRRQIGKVYQSIEVQLALMYDMLYTKAQVIHTRYGYCIRVISLVSCFVALVVFTKSKRDGYSTPGIVITFAVLGGACVLEMASVFKAIGSTWICDSLRVRNWEWLPYAILFARYRLLLVKDGRWSNSVGQFNFLSFSLDSNREDLKARIAKWIGLRDLWDIARCTKHVKLSPTLKKFVLDLLIGAKSHMVEIEEVDIRSGNWARRFRGIDDQIKQLDWSMSLEFQKSVFIWHIATSTFLNHPAIKSKLVDKDMAEEVNTLSHYMMYLLVQHPDILPMKPAAKGMLEETCFCYGMEYMIRWNSHDVVDSQQIILDYKKRFRDPNIRKLYGDWTHPSWDAYPGEAVMLKACTLAHTILDMELELTHKMAIIGTVWMEVLCYAATNASGGFHARQLSNGGEFLTHILLLAKYSSLIDKKPKPSKATDDAEEASGAGHVTLNVDDGCNDEITEIS